MRNAYSLIQPCREAHPATRRLAGFSNRKTYIFQMQTGIILGVVMIDVGRL